MAPPPEREREGGPDEAKLQSLLQRWADGKATLKDVRGYTDEELYSVAKTAYFFFYQGRINEARTLFQGLYAVNPLDPYFAKALGVVELAAGNDKGALAAYDVAIKLAPDDPSAYVGRAEVRLWQSQKGHALEDLRRADQLAPEAHAIKPKISAMLQALRGGGGK
jgi:type III secretion system low calcium response chaperone LcrH/SycD